MALTPGARLGVYDILTQIGAGGMGEVYRARDTSLGREVALKLLPRDVSTDPERLRRLNREARLLASLNHPGIATLHGLEECDGQRFLIMELVPGQTLAERVSQGALPIREALDVCRQIAEGLEAAHDAGIIHRDLKPANIKVAPDGRVKLLDFGLAKALETAPNGIESTLLAQEVTREGTILGTPSYMSPEQARGQAVDRRTDIWAFGCCLYESLTGRRAFHGNTVTDTLAAVLDRDPDWTELSDDVPPIVGRLLRRCLAKDVRQRVQHIGDARLELEDVGTTAHERPMRTRRPLRTLAVVAGTSGLVAAAAGLVYTLDGRRTGAPADRHIARLTLKLDGETPSDLSLVVNRFFIPFALSPDGERLVFRARGAKASQLWLRELSGFETRALPGTDLATTPFFSPDGQWVGFWRAEDRILRRVSIAGGTPMELGATAAPQNALWGLSDEIVFETAGPEAELWSIPADGGKAQPIPIRDRSKGERFSLRALIPGGKDLLVASTGPDGTWLDVLSRLTGRRHRLLRGGTTVLACYTGTGHLVYGDGDALFAAPLNEQFELVGPATPVLHGIDHFFRHSNVAISTNGTLVYLAAERIREGELAWLDREGHITPVAGGRAPFFDVALSPDGRQAAADLVDGAKLQVWIFDLERGAKRLLGSLGERFQPIWSHDGAFITYVSDREGATGLYRKRADGTGEEEFLVRRPNTWVTPEDWSPDGRSLLFSETTDRGDTDVWIYSGGKARPLLASSFNEASASFSPDGRFIAFAADDGGVNHVYVQPFPSGPRTTISIEEGGWPRWTPDGHQLLYGTGSRIMAVDVQTQPTLRVGQPRLLFDEQPGPRGRSASRQMAGA